MKLAVILFVWMLVISVAFVYIRKASARRYICNIFKAGLKLGGILVVPFLVLEVLLYTRLWEQLCIVVGLTPEIAVACKHYVWQALFLITFLITTWLLIVYFKETRGKGDKTTRPIATPSNIFKEQQDVPIKHWEEDIFNRRPFVEVLKSAIKGVDVRYGAVYIGVFGDWGTGKTSVVNLLKHDLLVENAAIFVDFSPWEFRNADDAEDGFMRIIADVAWRKGEYRVADCLSNYLQTIRLRKTDVKYGSIGLMLELVRWKLYRIAFNLHVRRAFLARQLGLMRRKIIVVVDDLERMKQQDVCNILRTIKTNFNLPNLVFLIVASKKHLLKAAANCLGSEPTDDDEKESLLKIVQFQFHLPAVPKTGIMEFFKLRLRKVLEDCGYTIKDYDVETDNGDGYETAAVYVKTLRSALVLSNAVWEALTYLRKLTEDGQLNIHIGDVVALCAMRLIDEKFYSALPGLFHKFVDAYRENYLFGDKGLDENEFKKWCDENTVEAHREICREFLKVRMGLEESDDKDGGKLYTIKGLFSDRQDLLAQYRLASPECFGDYFVGFSAVRHVPKSVLDEFTNRIERGQEVAEIFESCRKKSELPDLLFSLEGLQQFPTDKATVHYFKQLFMLARNRFAESEYSYIGIDGMPENIYTGIWRCASRYCKRYHTEAGRDNILIDISHVGDILFDAIKIVPEVHMIWRWLHTEYRSYADDSKYKEMFANDRFRSTLFDGNKYKQLQDIYLDAIEDYQTKNKVLDDREFFDLMRGWNICLLAKNDEERYLKLQGLFESSVGSISNVAKLIWFISQTKDQIDARTQIDAVNFLPIDAKGALRLFGRNLLEKMSTTLSSNMYALDINQRATAFALQYIIDNSFSEDKCTNEQQIAHIRGLINKITSVPNTLPKQQ